MSKKGKKRKTKVGPTPEQIEQMEFYGQVDRTRQLQGVKGRTSQMSLIPKIMKQHGLKVKQGISNNQLNEIQRQVCVYDLTITPDDAFVVVRGQLNRTSRRGVFGEKFTDAMAEELIKMEIRINNEGKLIQQSSIDNSQKYEYNPNARLDQRSMDLGSRRPVITEEQQRNEIMNDGSQKQKKNQQLNQSFPIESQEDLTQNAVFERDAPETTIAQERLEELRQQKLQSDLIASENLNTVYDISALDWGRPPVNEIYGRSPFVTHKTVYKYDQFGNPQAYIKTDNQTAGKIGVKDKDKGKMKKNYVPTSQLIAISSVQENLVKKFRKTNKKQKKK